MSTPFSARLTAFAALGTFVLAALPAEAGAQVRTVDPNAAMQSDLAPVPASEAGYGTTMAVDTPQPVDTPTAPGVPPPPVNTATAYTAPPQQQTTYRQEDVIDAAEGVFGKGAEGLAKLIENILSDQGEPNAYITGREAGGAIVVGVRYGSGVLHHKIEGDQPVFWTGPSVGFDLGANGAKTFVLVYNLYDTQDLFERFPAAEGNVYVVGGFTASYLRRGDIVLIPIRLGVGWRLGANVGYMKFSKKSKLLPF
ncbi:MAG TPA: DUF1134 domain-containing protein [Sphingomonadaceae bacterium]|nr:DUF1134 domain-containing protein [Sphingomonadaceae bacterium]